MKFSDDLYDVNQDIKLASIFGVLCAVSTALATVYCTEAAYIFFAVLIGNLLVIKVDGIHHIITLVLFLAIVLICGIPNVSLIILLICILAAVGDEVGHELIPKITSDRFLNFFFEYRFVMKIVILILAVSGVLSIWIFACFLCFEIAYEMAGILFEKFC